MFHAAPDVDFAVTRSRDEEFIVPSKRKCCDGFSIIVGIECSLLVSRESELLVRATRNSVDVAVVAADVEIGLGVVLFFGY